MVTVNTPLGLVFGFGEGKMPENLKRFVESMGGFWVDDSEPENLDPEPECDCDYCDKRYWDEGYDDSVYYEDPEPEEGRIVTYRWMLTEQGNLIGPYVTSVTMGMIADSFPNDKPVLYRDVSFIVGETPDIGVVAMGDGSFIPVYETLFGENPWSN